MYRNEHGDHKHSSRCRSRKSLQGISEEDRRRLEAILSIRLSEITHGGESLEDVMQEVSDKAKAHGLTPESLNSLLNGE